jgi:cation transport ATPase
VWDLARKLAAGTFGSDLLAGLSIVTSIVLGEYVAGVLVVLMLSGGEALESRAVARAGDVLRALARRMPTLAHRNSPAGLTDVPLGAVAVGDVVVVLPHEICPVDGTVVAGRGSMDESYLTGEPYRMAKAPGSTVLSGAINGQAALEVRADRVAGDSRYAKIMEVLRTSEERRPRLRRLADSLGALYTPLAVAIAAAAWWASGSATRFLAVLVVATPAPDRDPGRDHRRRVARRQAGHRDPRPVDPRAARHLPHRDLRQNGHAHLRHAPAHGGGARRRPRRR